MTTKKYELLEYDTVKIRDWFDQDYHTLHRIRALVDIGDYVKEGDLGGYIESESNLSHEGGAWVSGNARVYDNARVYSNALVSGDARVCGDTQQGS